MSKMNIKGKVTKFSERDWNDKRTGEDIILYSFQVEGESRWFRTGTKNPNVSDGDFIEFSFDTANGNVDVRSIKKGAEPATASSAPRQKGASGAGGAGGGREDYWQNKAADDQAKDKRYQKCDIPRMSFSAAQDRAVRLVSAAMDADALAFGNTAKGKRLDMLLNYVDLVTDRFFMQSMNAPDHLATLDVGENNIITDKTSNLDEDYDE